MQSILSPKTTPRSFTSLSDSIHGVAPWASIQDHSRGRTTIVESGTPCPHNSRYCRAYISRPSAARIYLMTPYHSTQARQAPPSSRLSPGRRRRLSFMEQSFSEVTSLLGSPAPFRVDSAWANQRPRESLYVTNRCKSQTRVGALKHVVWDTGVLQLRMDCDVKSYACHWCIAAPLDSMSHSKKTARARH